MIVPQSKNKPRSVSAIRASLPRRRIRRQSFFGVLLATATLASARSEDGPVATASATSLPSITLDGRLNEPAWRDAPVMKLVQQAPKPGQPTPYETEVRAIVTSDRIYFGFTCKDPDPRRIAIHTMRRDGDMTGDDTVSIVLDTYGLSDHFKSGQRLSGQNRPTEVAFRDLVVLPCRLLWRQVGFGSPAPRAAFEHVPVVQQAVEHGADGGRVSQQFAPVFHRAVRGQHGAGPLVAAHDNFQQLFGGGERQLAHAQVIDDE